MAKSYFHSGVGARIASAGAIAVTLMLGITLALTVETAHAQKKKVPAKASTNAPQSAWVKICDKGTLTTKDKAGKEEKKDLEMCMTLHEQIDANNGLVLLSSTFQQFKVDGKEKQRFIVAVPPGVDLPVGLGVTVFPKDLWQKLQKKQKLEKSEVEKLKSVKLSYKYCIQVSCSAEMEANPELLKLLQEGAGFIVETVRMPGKLFHQPVSLDGFKQALAGPPIDTNKFKEARTEVMKQIYERRKEMLAELKKQQETLNKMQPNLTNKEPPAKAKK